MIYHPNQAPFPLSSITLKNGTYGNSGSSKQPTTSPQAGVDKINWGVSGEATQPTRIRLTKYSNAEIMRNDLVRRCFDDMLPEWNTIKTDEATLRGVLRHSRRTTQCSNSAAGKRGVLLCFLLSFIRFRPRSRPRKKLPPRLRQRMDYLPEHRIE